MKNLHLLPTDKASRLVLDTVNNSLFLTTTEDFGTNIMKFQNIYITSDEEFENYNFVINAMGKVESVPNSKWGKKIILTDDKDLIADGVQAIDDEFLDWFVENPTCEEVVIVYENEPDLYGVDINYYKIIIPKEKITDTEATKFNANFFNMKFGTKEFNDMCSKYFGGNPKHKNNDVQEFSADAKWQQEKVHEAAFTSESKKESEEEKLKEAAEIHSKKMWGVYFEDIHPDIAITQTQGEISIQDFIAGAKWQQDRMYSEEEVEEKTLLAMINIMQEYSIINESSVVHFHKEWLEQFKKK